MNEAKKLKNYFERKNEHYTGMEIKDTINYLHVNVPSYKQTLKPLNQRIYLKLSYSTIFTLTYQNTEQDSSYRITCGNMKHQTGVVHIMVKNLHYI